MGKTIEVRLSDAQHAQLVAEAEASGLPLFGYCRVKLTFGDIPHTEIKAVTAHDRKMIEDRMISASAAAFFDSKDTIKNIEMMLLEIARTMQSLGNSAYITAMQPIEPPEPSEPPEPFDVEGLVNEQFAEAEASGLTERIPDEVEEVMAQSGMRPLSRRPIRFSTTPRHLQGLG